MKLLQATEGAGVLIKHLAIPGVITICFVPNLVPEDRWGVDGVIDDFRHASLTSTHSR
ncbi:hypothetical protein ACQP2K_40595 [Microbispora siamensis]